MSRHALNIEQEKAKIKNIYRDKNGPTIGRAVTLGGENL
jgi:hypothetical protein